MCCIPTFHYIVGLLQHQNDKLFKIYVRLYLPFDLLEQRKLVNKYILMLNLVEWTIKIQMYINLYIQMI